MLCWQIEVCACSTSGTCGVVHWQWSIRPKAVEGSLFCLWESRNHSKLTLQPFFSCEWSYKRWTYKTGKKQQVIETASEKITYMIYLICLAWKTLRNKQKTSVCTEQSYHLKTSCKKICIPIWAVDLNVRTISVLPDQPFLSSPKKSYRKKTIHVARPLTLKMSDKGLTCSWKCLENQVIKSCFDCKHIDDWW